MGKFTQKSAGSTKTKNYEGADAFKLNPQMELYSLVCTSTLEPKFYVPDTQATLDRLRDLVEKNDPLFVAKLAIYAREQMYLRSIPLVLAVEMAKAGFKKDGVVEKTVQRVIQRADELAEILGYYQLANKRQGTKKLGKLSKQIQRGVAEAFGKFDEYQFGKYNCDADVTLRDAMFLCHPKPKSAEQKELFKKIAEQTLEVPYTWEVELSKLGQQEFETPDERRAAFRAKWEELIESKKLGYMALLRNLRNILMADVADKRLGMALSYLSNPDAVRKSKQLPFRFLSAYRELENARLLSSGMVMDALEDAMKVSVENIQGFSYDTSMLIACDVSGSMKTPISPRSSVRQYDIGLVLGMMLRNKCKKVITGIFGTDWKPVQLPSDPILANTRNLDRLSNQVGRSTNGWKIIQRLIDDKQNIDKVMIFTDRQLWNSTQHDAHINEKWSQYKKFSPESKLYIFDLSGYGTSSLSIHRDDVHLIAGWSDKIFNVLAAIERGESAVSEIEKLEL